jgi:hypothetical protein
LSARSPAITNPSAEPHCSACESFWTGSDCRFFSQALMKLNDAATATLTIAFDSVVVLQPFDDELL